MLASGTFVLGKEKESRSDKVRMFTAVEWSPYYDRKAEGTRHRNRFVTLKFMGYKKDEILNWNEGDTIFVSGRYEDEPYMGKLSENAEQQSNAKEGYEPRSGCVIMVESLEQVQFSKESKDKLDTQNGGWGYRQKDSGSSRSSGAGRDNNSRDTRSRSSNSSSRGREDDDQNDDREDDRGSRSSGNNRQQQSNNRDSGRGGNNGGNGQSSRNQGRSTPPADDPEEVDENAYADLELPQT